MSNKKRDMRAAILLEGGSIAHVSGSKFVGDNARLIARGGSTFYTQANEHISTEVIALYVSMENELNKLKKDIDHDTYQKILSEIQNLNKHRGTTTFNSAYKGFVSTLSDHVTVLTAFAPYIAQLTHYL